MPLVVAGKTYQRGDTRGESYKQRLGKAYRPASGPQGETAAQRLQRMRQGGGGTSDVAEAQRVVSEYNRNQEASGGKDRYEIVEQNGQITIKTKTLPAQASATKASQTNANVDPRTGKPFGKYEPAKKGILPTGKIADPIISFGYGATTQLGITPERPELQQKSGGASTATSYELGRAAGFVATPLVITRLAKGAGAIGTGGRVVSRLAQPTTRAGVAAAAIGDTAVGSGAVVGSTVALSRGSERIYGATGGERYAPLQTPPGKVRSTISSYTGLDLNPSKPLSPGGLNVASIAGVNRASEAGGRVLTRESFGYLQSKGYQLSRGQLFNVGSLSIAPVSAIEGVSDVSLSRLQNKQRISGRDVIIGSAGGASFGGILGGAIITRPYLKTAPARGGVRFTETAVNILDPGEVPGDVLQDMAERNIVSKGGSVKSAATSLSKEGKILPEVITESRARRVIITPSFSQTKQSSKSKSYNEMSTLTKGKSITSELPALSGSKSSSLTKTPSRVTSSLPSISKTPISAKISTSVSTKTPVASKITSSISTKIPVTNADVPFFPLGRPPEGGGFGLGGGGKGKKTQSNKYLPSLTGIFTGVKARSKKASGYSGLEVRGI